MIELKLGDDFQDPRLEEPANDTQCKENISPSEPPSVSLVCSEERKRKRQGTKIPKRSKAVKGTVVFLTVDGVPSYKLLIRCDLGHCLKLLRQIQATLSYSTDKQKLTMVVHRCCNLPMEPDDPEKLPDPYVKCYLNPGDSDSED
ncbi:unnamed protein product [Cyprideis torosa]|uniref:Uncharacterized protein n=1 Tax=Cyprideis torosa TaxID=163714 RepID=A0A7R8ZUT2_9CRUS|nr:unnamed protein product [Cyprideis torosa]CAG0900938.1 unnamed protein product [Cyprideis torosa]